MKCSPKSLRFLSHSSVIFSTLAYPHFIVEINDTVLAFTNADHIYFREAQGMLRRKRQEYPAKNISQLQDFN
jgi:hypothetical protein